jgi:hypothetical protein
MRSEAVSGSRLAVSQSALRAVLTTAYSLQPTACDAARRS